MAVSGRDGSACIDEIVKTVIRDERIGRYHRVFRTWW